MSVQVNALGESDVRVRIVVRSNPWPGQCVGDVGSDRSCQGIGEDDEAGSVHQQNHIAL